MRYFDDGFVACPQCEGYGVDLNSYEISDCPRCDGVGALPVDGVTLFDQPQERLSDTIWSPLLCDPDTIKRVRKVENTP